ncbi:hypothetical protein SLA2020_468100 [Shorea laevis]
MEAVRFTSPHPPLLRHKMHQFSASTGPQVSTKTNPNIRPVISARLSEQTAEPSPAVTYQETSFSSTVSSSPPKRVSFNSLQYPPGYLGAVRNCTVTEGNGSIINAMEYLTNILSSEREDLQPVFSFKLRGAYNMMAKLREEQLERGVICSSAGNHAQGVALSAQRLGCNAVIVMPVTTPEIKWQSVERLGATVVLVGDSYDEAQAYAKKRANEESLTFIPPFDHRDVIAGQGTVGMEIVRQMQEPLHAIFVPVGGGGLIAGIAAYVKRVSPEVKIIGVEPSDANAMALSLHHGERVMLDQVGGFADGVAVKEVAEETFRLCKELLDGIVLVGRDAICASIKDMFEEKRSILEPAGALALAGAEAYCRRQEALLATVMPEIPGSFKQFCELVGPVNITEFNYRSRHDKEAIVLYSVGVHMVSEVEAMKQRMESAQLRTHDLTSSDLVKDHLRYMMGGRLSVENEVLCRFIFPERPGALMKFLDAFSPRWNISLFHYRAQGETGANVLAAIQVAKSEMNEFHHQADSLGYEYEVVTDDNNFKLLLH